MAILGKHCPATAHVDTLLYRVPDNRRAVLNVSLLNRHTTNVVIRIALVRSRDMIVNSVTLTEPGSGYTVIPTITVIPPEGTVPSLTATIAVVSMQAASVALDSGGSGYGVGEVLELQGGTATTLARVRVESVGAEGEVTLVSIVEPGLYTVLGEGARSVSGGSGTGAQFRLSFGIRAINLTHQGQGYRDTPSLSVPGGSGFSAVLEMAQAVEDDDYLEFDALIPTTSVLERTGLALSAGDALFVRANLANKVNVLAIGFEEVA